MRAAPVNTSNPMPSPAAPPLSIQGYHAHVYFSADTIAQARALCAAAAGRFALAMGRVHERPVGPHPDWSCQLAFGAALFGEIVPWLNAERAGLTVFVHPLTGDELADHRDHAIWLGHSRPLDLSAFLPTRPPSRPDTKPLHITLHSVTRDNFEAITDLELLPHQEDYLASNSYSIAQASFNPHLQTRAVYADETLVGFMLYATPGETGVPGGYSIWRFMVDAQHQGGGIGRQALERLIAEILAHGGVRQIGISYVPDNTAAQRFYASFGFVEQGIDDSGEMVAVRVCGGEAGG
jgi:diamine N-acetyltransferase